MFKFNIFCGVLIKKAAILKFALLVLLFSVLANEGFAATKTSTTLGGPFNLSTSWVGGVAPIAGDDVIIDGPIVITAHTVLVSSVQVTSNGVLSVSANGVSLNVSGNITNAGNIKFWDSNISGVYGRISISAASTCHLSGTGEWNLGTITIGNGSELAFDDDMIINIASTITWASTTSKFNVTAPVSNTTLVFNGVVSGGTIESTPSKAVYPNIQINKTGNYGVAFSNQISNVTLPILGSIDIVNSTNFISLGNFNTLEINDVSVSGLGYFRAATAVGPTTIHVLSAGDIVPLRLSSTANVFITNLIVDAPLGVTLYSQGTSTGIKNSIVNNSSITFNSNTTRFTLGNGASPYNNGTITGYGVLVGHPSMNLILSGVSATDLLFSTNIGENQVNGLTINKTAAVTLQMDFTVNGSLTLNGSGALLSINDNTLTLNGATNFTNGSLSGSSGSNLILGGISRNSTIVFDQAIPGVTNVLNNLSIDRTNNTNNTVSISTNLNIGGTLTVTQDFNKVAPSNTGILTLYGDITGSGTLSGAATSSLVIDGSGASDLKVTNNTFFGNLTIYRAVNFIPGNNFTVSNQLTIASGASLTLPTALIIGSATTPGDLVADGTLIAQPTSSLTLYGNGSTSPQLNFSQASVADKTLSNLTIDRSGSAVVIPNSNELYVKNAFVLTAGDLNIGDGKLYLNGNITTNATGYLSANGNSELYITSVVNINNPSSLFFNPSANTLKLLNIARLTTGAGIISLGNALNITDNLDVSGLTSQFNANGFLTLLSTASKTANVGPIANTASITGSVTAQRFVTGGSYNPYRSFRMFSSPVNDASGITNWSASQLIDNIFITGPGDSANGFDDSPSSQPSVYNYNEPATTASGLDYVSIPQVNASVASASIGQGLMVFYRGDRSNPSVMTSQTINPASTVMDFIGTLNQKNITRSLSYTANGESTDGFNLLGNPYQCTIDWDAAGWTKTGITGTIYVYNPAQRTYATYDGSFGANGGSQYIYPGQAFFVQATAGGASVTFTENIKASSVQPTSPLGGAPLLLSAPVFAKDRTLKLMEASPAIQAAKSSNTMQAPLQNGIQSLSNNVIKTRLEKGSFYDETVVVFKDNESSSYTAKDAVRLDGGSGVALASQSTDQKRLAINYMDGIANVSSVKLYVGVRASGNYTLNFTDISLPAGYHTQLKDNYLNAITDINSASQYAFAVDTAKKTSFGNNRFEILVNNPTTLSVDLTAFTGKATTQGAMLNWKTSSEKDNDLFEVERSLDGQTFVKIGSVKSKSTNSTTPNNYEFLDAKPALGLNYYRLKQIDLDGTPTIIDPIALNFNGLALNNVKLTLYPNPTVDKINIAFAGLNVKKGYISVVDVLGKKLINKNIGEDGNEAQLSLDVNNLNPGIYFVEIYDGNKVISKGNKFIKQ